MRNLKKLIVITAIAALLFCVLMSCAMADERLYTSEVFKLPKELLTKAIESQEEPEAELPETPQEVENPEGEVLPGEDVKPEGTDETGEKQPEEIPSEKEPDAVPSEKEPDVVPAEKEPDEVPVEKEPDEVPGEKEPDEVPGEKEPDEVPGEKEPEETPAEKEPDETPAKTEPEEPAQKVRKVVITSNQADIVTEGDLITLHSELIGFEDVTNITYQWQADKGNGAGWEDMNGGIEADYTFVANKESIQWSWRLIVNYDD